MGLANKYNKGKKFDFVTPKDFKYESLKDLFNNNGGEYIYTVRALYVNNKSKFGESVVAVTDEQMVNLPKHLNDVVKQMLLDEELIDAVNKGAFGFKIYPYESKDGNVYYSVNWFDIVSLI